jgi:hypothetical protein
MDIKPTGPGTGLPSLSGPEDRLNKPKFEETRTQPASSLESGAPFAGVAASFQRSDLQDPAKLETMMSQCASELVGSALGQVNGQLPPADTQYLTEWLQNDPTIRARVLNCLQRVLT